MSEVEYVRISKVDGNECTPKTDEKQLKYVYILMETLYDIKSVIGVFRDETLAEEKRNSCQEEMNLRCRELSCEIPIYEIEIYELQ